MEPFSAEESLSGMNKYVREWFESHFKELTLPQRFAFKLIREQNNVLITAPTGSGKTLSGFVSILGDLFDMAANGTLAEEVYCIYISPLRALNNDIYRNLIKPLEDIYSIVDKERAGTKHVTIAVRTGDTPQSERRAQLIHPPNILVTTPESLAILINSEKYMQKMSNVKYIIIDEIHELANNKRGAHLSLSIERLSNLIGHDFVRIGLGATLYPLEEAAKFLVGYKNGKPKDCKIVDASWSKKLDVITISPVEDMIYTPDEKVEKEMYNDINKIIKSSKTTLIFTNTRSGTERVVFNLKKKFGYKDEIAAHHGSLSRDSRLEVEELLKAGSLKCAVSSTSLELGVDIGSIDNVIQLGSPKSITRALQRIGRAGHQYKSTAKGEIIVLNRDDLVECSVMLDAALKRHLDSFTVPKNALDVLAQHIMGMSLNKKWDVKEAFEVIRSAYPYSSLAYEDYISTLKYLAGEYVGLESRRVYGKIWYDEKEGMFGRRGKFAKPIYMLNLGTIPDEVAVNVLDAKSKKWLGNIEEEFLTRLKQGDIFTLGGRLYRFEYAKGMKCYVSDAKSSTPTIPPWFSEQLPLSYELAMEIGRFRRTMAESIVKSGVRAKSKPRLSGRMPKESSDVLKSMPIERKAAKAIYNYFVEQLLFAGIVPNDKLMLVEITKDPQKGQNIVVFHSLYGRRINDALSRIIAIHIGRALGIDVGIMINDNGFLVTTEIPLGAKDLENAINASVSKDPVQLLRANIRRTEIMKRRFRHVAARSFMILRNYKGWKQPVGKQQINAQLLIKAVESIDKNFPVLKETYREIFEEVMDLPRTKQVLASMAANETEYKIIKTQVPSPFAHSMLTFGHADAILMKERHEYLRYLHKLVLKRIKANA